MVGSRTPHVTRGCVPRPSWAGTKQPPDCIGQTLGSTWRGRVATSPLGTRPPRQGQCFSLGLKEGVGFNPRVNFDGERKVSPSAGSPPCLRTIAPPPPHQLPSALHHFDGGDHFDLRQPCLLMIEVGRRVVGPVLPRRQGSSPHSRQAGVTRRQFNSGRPGSLYSIR